MHSISDAGRGRLHAKAKMTFLADRETKPLFIASVGGGDQTEHLGSFVDQLVPIEDGRSAGEVCKLDREGFELVTQETEVQNFYDDAQLRDIYDAELQTLVKTVSGARRVVVFDHTRRSDSLKMQAEHRIREPAAFVHNDYSERSARQRLRDIMGDEAEDLLKRRFAIINVWRSMAGIVESSPLAFCDARTIEAPDLVASERRAKGRIGEVQQALYNEKQRWVCFPHLKPSEAILLKVFDCAEDGRARLTIHSAFSDPSTPEGAPARESIESRTFAFF